MSIPSRAPVEPRTGPFRRPHTARSVRGTRSIRASLSTCTVLGLAFGRDRGPSGQCDSVFAVGAGVGVARDWRFRSSAPQETRATGPAPTLSLSPHPTVPQSSRAFKPPKPSFKEPQATPASPLVQDVLQQSLVSAPSRRLDVSSSALAGSDLPPWHAFASLGGKHSPRSDRQHVPTPTSNPWLTLSFYGHPLPVLLCDLQFGSQPLVLALLWPWRYGDRLADPKIDSLLQNTGGQCSSSFHSRSLACHVPLLGRASARVLMLVVAACAGPCPFRCPIRGRFGGPARCRSKPGRADCAGLASPGRSPTSRPPTKLSTCPIAGTRLLTVFHAFSSPARSARKITAPGITTRSA